MEGSVMARLILTLQTIGVAVLLLCAVGNVRRGDWDSVAVALASALLLVTA
jgi:hypothetical protein